MVLSPGPGSPASYAENLAQVWKHNPPIPTLGICLGYQSLCLNNDATISSLEIPCHGHISNIHHIGEDIFQGIADMKGMRYHSLFAKDIKGSLTEIAWENGDHDLVMAVKHRNKPHRGVLFHPESVCSTSGEIMIKNFYDLAESHNQSRTLSPLLKEWDKLDIRPQPLIKLVRNKTITAVRTAVLEFAVGADTKRLTSQLCYGKQNYVLLESMTPGERWTIFAQFGGPQSKLLQYYTDPARVVVTNSANKSKTFKTSLCQYAASLMEDQDSYIGVENVPFWGGLIGTVGYSVGSAKFDTFTPSTCTKDPQASLLFADRSIVIDHQEHIIFVQSINQNDQTWIESKRDELSRMFSNSVPRPTRIPPNDEFRVDFPDKADYLDAIADAQAHLRAGDSYEICLTGITNVSLPRNDPKDIYSLYHHVRKNNPSPFACLVKLKGSHIIGSSPERFMRYSKNDCEFRPMKGTLKRGQYTYDQACEILQNPKDQAELRIICDLIRNDLHQIADPIDSVTVPKITSTEEFTSVYQLTSHVKGHIEPPFTGWDVLAHSLPPGSMTGAPKKRTLEIIDSLEKKRRGLYSGVTGYSSFNGNHDWSVNIRMAFQLPSYPSNQWSLGAGGAITILSDPESEWDEMITKLHSILPSMFDATAAAGQNAGQESFKILETTLLDPMATEPILMLDLHLQRARLATQAFNFVWPGSRYISQKLKDFSAKATTKSKVVFSHLHGLIISCVGQLTGAVVLKLRLQIWTNLGQLCYSELLKTRCLQIHSPHSSSSRLQREIHMIQLAEECE